MKNAQLKRHFLNPVGMKRIEHPTYQSICKSDTCSDVIRMTVVVDAEGMLSDIGTEVYGCGYSIAGASLFNSAVLNGSMEEAVSRAEKAAAEVLADVPEQNRRCIELSVRAFQSIYEQYRSATQH